MIVSCPNLIMLVSTDKFSSQDWASINALSHKIAMNKRPRLAISLRLFKRVLIFLLWAVDLSCDLGKAVYGLINRKVDFYLEVCSILGHLYKFGREYFGL